jgi:hypothetical protein
MECTSVSSTQSTLMILKSIYSSSGSQHLKNCYCLAWLDNKMLKLDSHQVTLPATPHKWLRITNLYNSFGSADLQHLSTTHSTIMQSQSHNLSELWKL